MWGRVDRDDLTRDSWRVRVSSIAVDGGRRCAEPSLLVSATRVRVRRTNLYTLYRDRIGVEVGFGVMLETTQGGAYVERDRRRIVPPIWHARLS